MKIRIFGRALLLLAILAACGRPAATTYWCPMHPEVTSADPNAQCDKCGGMKLVPKEPDAKPVTSAPAPKGAKYFCPMHPQITADKPGDCPICNMRLVPATAATPATPSGVTGLATVQISPEVRQRIGLKLGRVERRPLTREMRAPARIVPAESRLHQVTVRVEGWAEEVFVTSGQAVRAGEPLLTVFSPELLAAQREVEVAGEAARRRLERLGLDGNTLRAPVSGHVLRRDVAPGQRVMPNEALLVIADLSTVWAEVELSAADAGAVTVGAPVTITARDRSVTGTVFFVSPALDPVTRTARARVELANADGWWKPEMLATAMIAVPVGERLAVPAAAVLQTGERTYAFRDAGEGKLMPVVVQIGARAGEWWEVREGLAEGDAVVVSANFLVDSESQLKAALSGMGGHPH